MNPTSLADLIRRWVGLTVSDERPKRATITAVSGWDTSGEVAATFADGHTVYIHAATPYSLGVGDIIYVQKQQVGLARARYTISGYHESSGGSRIPEIRPESIVAVIDDMLTDDSSTVLMQD